jgi:hypothetical protein
VNENESSDEIFEIKISLTERTHIVSSINRSTCSFTEYTAKGPARCNSPSRTFLSIFRTGVPSTKCEGNTTTGLVLERGIKQPIYEGKGLACCSPAVLIPEFKIVPRSPNAFNVWNIHIFMNKRNEERILYFDSGWPMR